MSSYRRPSTSLTQRTYATTDDGSYSHNTTTNVYSTTQPSRRQQPSRQSMQRPGTARPRTAFSTLGVEAQRIICAISESRGISPTVGLALVNLDTGEAVLSQICDSQTYVRTIHKLMIYSPSVILVVDTAVSPPSKLFSIIEENLVDLNSNIVLLERRYWSETTGLEYIQQLAFEADVEAVKVSIGSNYFAVCSFAAVVKYVEMGMSISFPLHSLSIRYEPSEGSMMVDISTIQSLELIQNLHNPKSRDCLFGLLNNAHTAMGSRLLRSNLLQPLTDEDTLNARYDAVEELSTREEIFFATNQALKGFVDIDKVLSSLLIVPMRVSIPMVEQAVNNIISLKGFLASVEVLNRSLVGARSAVLQGIYQITLRENSNAIRQLIDRMINKDTMPARSPLELRNQRNYAVKSGVNGLLDVARQTFKEGTEDAFRHVQSLAEEHNLALETMFDNPRQAYIRFLTSELEGRTLPPIFVNVMRKKKFVECQTLDLKKMNQKIADSHAEVLMMSDRIVNNLIDGLRCHLAVLFKMSESVAVLDMISSFAQIVTSQDYVRPQFGDTLAIKAGRHPLREKIQRTRFIPNDVFASQRTRFQIITGCNMSGKSTYIRAVALMAIMAQVGCFVPAQYATFPVTRQVLARISIDDHIGANVSTFAAEMREMAYILRNVDRHSIVIVDELGRGTSTRDGLAIALAIAESLVESRALVWFATHFRDLAKVMAERSGVVNMHLEVDTDNVNAISMLYRVVEGVVTEEHYGLTLARVLPFPPDVLERASEVASILESNSKRQRDSSLSIVQARRRKLVLNLKEQLVQAHQGAMHGPVLRSWLQQLQRDFVVRMSAIDAEARQAVPDSSTAGFSPASTTFRVRPTASAVDDRVKTESASGSVVLGSLWNAE